ncbi:unnamed protein product [Cuscuta epithymum]|uniref:Methionyl/Leucyl tRNA synthetase domain-containing protein n=1 Tax=Cuscuta epithymum TaxID=186058 RepID=A0AAV0F6B0_9ASTE|nr:unnamed protein product [Cuscuta epithymum]
MCVLFDAPLCYISITKLHMLELELWWKNPQNVELHQFISKNNVPHHTISILFCLVPFIMYLVCCPPPKKHGKHLCDVTLLIIQPPPLLQFFPSYLIGTQGKLGPFSLDICNSFLFIWSKFLLDLIEFS